MSTIVNHQENLKAAFTYGIVVGGAAAVGIGGSRYISTLPMLPIKAAGVVAVATFISTLASGYFLALFPPNEKNDSKSIKLLRGVFIFGIIIIGGASLTTYGNKRFVDPTIFSYASSIMLVASQVIGFGLMCLIPE